MAGVRAAAKGGGRFGIRVAALVPEPLLIGGKKTSRKQCIFYCFSKQQTVRGLKDSLCRKRDQAITIRRRQRVINIGGRGGVGR